MHRNTFHRIVALLIVTLGVGVGCGGGSAPEASAAGSEARKGAPSGTYESSLPDGSVMRLVFHGGGKVDFAMTEDGATNTFAGKWVQNGDVILAEGGEGMTLELRWQGQDLVTNSLGWQLTFARP
jgi:hypothetical protein